MIVSLSGSASIASEYFWIASSVRCSLNAVLPCSLSCSTRRMRLRRVLRARRRKASVEGEKGGTCTSLDKAARDAPSSRVVGVVAQRFLTVLDRLVVAARQVEAQAAVVEWLGLLRVETQEVAAGGR